MSKKNILIYGATGSIGDSTLNLIRNNKKLFNVVGLTCNNNVGKLINIANEFECKNLGIYDESQVSKYSELKNFNIYFGLSNFHKLVTVNVDIIIFAISGSSPFHLLMDLAKCGKVIGIANKECIICLGKIFLDKAKLFSTKIIPLDSEHNAIYQLMKNRKKSSIRKFTITASGGNFYNYTYNDLKKITVDQAVTHPQWKMGRKITVDSSTLMNKGLEIIEACILFDIDPIMIDAVIHPESIIHGMIEYKDTSTHAFLSHPNMEISISSVLFNDNIADLSNYVINLIKLKSLNFYEIDKDKFNAIDLAKFSLREGGLIPAVFNYTNELMVDLFLSQKILFTDIPIFNEKIIKKFILDGNNVEIPDISDISEAFKTVDTYLLSLKSIVE
tara:strand:- start:11 stop:1174 length:1164 start_codon:yes stop_codon:yes gene_type:complete